jgi:hypothetical protein
MMAFLRIRAIHPVSLFAATMTLSPAIGAIAFTFAFWCVALALGYRLLRIVRIPFAHLTAWEYGFVSLAFGAACLQYLPYALGLFGRLTPPYVRASLALLTALLIPDLVRIARAFTRRVSTLHLRRLPAPAFLWAGLFAILMATLLIRAMAVGGMSDDDGYHLSAPKRWLSAGTLAYLPTYTNTNAAMGFEMLYAIALATSGVMGATLLHYSVGLFSLLGIVLAAARIADLSTGVLAISLLLIRNPVFDLPFLFTHAYVDFAACWMTVASVLVWLAWREHRERALLGCVALFAGLSGSFKITALCIAIGWAVSLVADTGWRDGAWKIFLRRLVIFGAISAIPVLPWLYRNWTGTGNPLFPMLSGLIPTRDWTIEHGRLFARYTRYYAWGVASGARLDETHRKIILLTTGIVVSAAAAVALVRIKQPVLRRLIFLASFFILISLGTTGLVFRYWLPAIMLLILVAVSLLPRRGVSPHRPLWAASAAVGIALLVRMSPQANVPRRSLVRDLKIVAGMSSFGREYPDDPLWDLSSYINSNTPSDARILFAAFYLTYGASSFGGLWIDRTCYTTDSHLQRFLRLDDWNSFLRSVYGAHVSHVVISDEPYLAGRHGFSFLAGQNEYPFSRRLVDQYGEKLLQIRNMQLYRIRLPSGLERAGN